MIISHAHRFIFIKTEKTAGTSIEIALSKYCGPDDVITRVSPEDEDTRREYGGRGPQNCIIPSGEYNLRDWFRFVVKRRRREFFNHASAKFIRAHIPRSVWDSYYKFCFERNPWDKAVSYCYWVKKKEDAPSVSEFIQSGESDRVRGYGLYSIRGEIAVDKVYLFEHLEREMADIARVISLPEVPALPHAKGSYRKDRRHYRELLTPEDREHIARVHAPEIAHCGYEW